MKLTASDKLRLAICFSVAVVVFCEQATEMKESLRLSNLKRYDIPGVYNTNHGNPKQRSYETDTGMAQFSSHVHIVEADISARGQALCEMTVTRATHHRS
jgi:hypothetical protein